MAVRRVLTISIHKSLQIELGKELHRTRLRLNKLVEDGDNVTEEQKHIHDIVQSLCGFPSVFSESEDPCIMEENIKDEE